MERNGSKVKITIDGKELVVDGGITVLEAARLNGIAIPTLCHHPDLTPWGGCRLCVVEVDGAPKLAASCVTPVRDGMQVVTTNDRILESRRAVLEFLFAERNHNCMFCPQSGDCELQKLAYEMQMDHLTVSFSFDRFPTDVTSEYMVTDHNRCILCGRCVRACAELSGNHVLNFQNRGPRSLIGLDLNETRGASTCVECGICMQFCPTGAITNRYRAHVAVKGHSKEWQEVDSVCSNCGLLCPTVSLVRDNQLLKVNGRLAAENGRPDKGQLCRRGRFEVLKEGTRLLRPRVRQADGNWKEKDWGEVLGLVAGRLGGLKKQYGGDGLLGLASSSLSNEELLLFKDLMEKGWGARRVDTLDGGYYRSILGGLKGMDPGWKEASWKEVAGSDFVLVIGGSPYESQPLLTSLLRKGMLERGLRVAMVGATERHMARSAYELPVRNGDETRMTEAFLAAAKQISDGPATKTGAPGILKGIELDDHGRKIFDEIVGAFMEASNPLVIVGEDWVSKGGEEAVRSAVQIGRLKGLLTDGSLRVIFLKPSGNSAGAWRLGIPSKEKGGGAAPAGKGAILVLGGERDPSLVEREDLKHLDFLAVVTPYLRDDLMTLAHVLIPKPASGEEEGTFTSLDGREIAHIGKMLEPPASVQESWKILLELGNGSGSQLETKTLGELTARVERAVLAKDQG
jgi:formate dehydrogenase major subunit